MTTPSKEDITAALMGAERKWETILQDHTFIERPCGLCKMFKDEGDGCLGCPIAGKTGQVNCIDTPMDEWKTHQNTAHGRWIDFHRELFCIECVNIIGRHLEFLRGLKVLDGIDGPGKLKAPETWPEEKRYFTINVNEPYARIIFEVLKAGQIAKGKWPEGDISFEQWKEKSFCPPKFSVIKMLKEDNPC